MAAGAAEARAGPRMAALPLLAVLGLVALGACVLVAVTALTDRRTQLLEETARTGAERQAGRIALALRDIETSVEHLDPSACAAQQPGVGPEVSDSVPNVPTPTGATLRCLPAGTTRLDGLPVDFADRAVEVALGQSRDLGGAVLSAPAPDVPPVVAAPIYLVDGQLSLVPSERTVQVRREELVGHAVAVVDVAALVDGDGDWVVSDAGTVLGETGRADGEGEVAADVDALGRRWTVVTPVPTIGWWRPAVIAVVGLGVTGGVLLGLADRRRRRAADAGRVAMRQAERRAASIRTLTGVVQSSPDLDEILPALAVQVTDELGLHGLSLAVAAPNGSERAVFTHGTRPDPAVRPIGHLAAPVPAGGTVAFDLHRAERSIAVLRAVAGRELDHDALELLAVAGEMITSTIVAGRSIEQQQEAVARLEALDELKTTFLGVASHELRTPATAISGLATLLASRWDALTEEDRRSFATRIATNADALNELVQDLLDFARLERGDLQLALTEVDLSGTVERVLSRLDSVWGSHSVIRVVESDVAVIGEVNAIERIVTNLVSNAVKFSPRDSGRARDGRAAGRSGPAPGRRLRSGCAGRGAGEDLRAVLPGRRRRGGAHPRRRDRPVGRPGLRRPDGWFGARGGEPHRRGQVRGRASKRSTGRGSRSEMLRRRERLLPAAAFLALLAIGVLVLVLLTSAANNGRRALEEAVQSEVEATARSQNAGAVSQLATFASLLGSLTAEFDFEVGSEADLAALADLIRLVERAEEFRTGFFLTDADGIITQGFRVRPDAIGERLERPDADLVLEGMRDPGGPFARGGPLPLGPGVTSDLPNTAALIPLRDPATGSSGAPSCSSPRCRWTASSTSRSPSSGGERPGS